MRRAAVYLDSGRADLGGKTLLLWMLALWALIPGVYEATVGALTR